MRVVRLALIVVAVLFLAPACDTFPAESSIGVTRTSGGSVQVLYLTCPYETVNRVEVVVPVDNPGGGDDKVLWRVVHMDKSVRRSGTFVVGSHPPPGFAESVPLTRPLPEGVTLAALVSTTGASEVVVAFRVANVHVGQIRTWYDGEVSPAEFRATALETCSQ
jgi:hypothetical protein